MYVLIYVHTTMYICTYICDLYFIHQCPLLTNFLRVRACARMRVRAHVFVCVCAYAHVCMCVCVNGIVEYMQTA